MRVAAALTLCLALVPGAAAAACRPDEVDIRSAAGAAHFHVEVAATPEARSRGLMFRTALPGSAGMLFVFDAPTSPAFWMKNTLIPLDMIFIDRTGTVTRVHVNARPQDTTPVPGGDGVLAVLEINGGLAARLGIAPGAQLRHPAFANGPAAWPCEP